MSLVPAAVGVHQSPALAFWLGETGDPPRALEVLIEIIKGK